MATFSSGSHSFRSFDAYPSSSRSRPSSSSFSFGKLFSDRFDPVVQKHLRRVYTSLLTALTLASIGSLLTLQLYLRNSRHVWLATLSTYLTLPTLLWFMWTPRHSRMRAPAFYTFAFVDGAAAAPLLALVSQVDPQIPALAFVGAASVFLCCTLSALLAKRGSYLFLGSLCFTALMGLGLVSLVASLWSSFVPYSMMMYVGLLVFCGYVLYDTQIIVEKAHAGDRDHLQHALELLIDFIAIFKRIAIIMAKNQAERQRRDDGEGKKRNKRYR